MKLLYKDQLRKIKSNLFYFISLSILVMVISFTYTSVKTSINRLDNNYDTYLEDQNLEDFYFALNNFDITYLSARQQLYMCSSLDILLECSLVDFDDGASVNNINALITGLLEDNLDLYNEMTDTIAYDLGDKFDITIEKAYVTTVNVDDYIYKFHSITEEIDIPYIIEGYMPVEKYDIAVFPEFAEANNINLLDTLTINGTDYKVTAFMYKVEYIMPLISLTSIEYDPLYQTIVLTTDETIFDLDQFIFNKYLGKGNIDSLFTEFGYNDVYGSDLSFLGKNMQMVSVIMPSEINFRIIALPTEVDNAQIFIDIFISVFIIMISTLLLVFMKRYIDKNKEDINTLYSLGYNNFEITKMLMIFPLIISINSFIGYILGMVFSNKLFDLYSARYLFPKSGFEFSLQIFIIAVIIPVIAILIFNLLFIIKTLNFKKKPIYHKIFSIFKFTPLKTLLITGILFLIVNVMIIFSITGNQMFTSFIDYTKVGNNYDLQISLTKFTNDPYEDFLEPFTIANGEINKINDKDLTASSKLLVYGIEPTNDKKLLINNDINNNLLLEDGVIISEYTSSLLNINIGDLITYSVGKATDTKEVVGISNELISNALYTSKEQLNSLFELDSSYYNGVYSTDNTYEHPLQKSVLNYNKSLDEFSSILTISSIIMFYLLILSSILSLFILGLIIYTYLNDNKINIAILKSIGYSTIEINKLYLKNILVVFVIMFIIAIPLTKALLDYVLKLLMDNLGFQLIADITSLNILVGLVIVSTVIVTTIYLVNKFMSKISIAMVMSHNIK